MAYRLPPLHANLNKRIVKTPKLHFYDTGLVCYLLGIRSPDELRGHPLRGAIFETWVAAEVVKAHYHRGAVPALAKDGGIRGSTAAGAVLCYCAAVGRA